MILARRPFEGATAFLVLLACLLAASTASAGPADSDRVVGGTDTTIEQWPWQAAIASPPSGGGNGFDRQFCGGSLVAPMIVITAAHCVYHLVNPIGCTPLDGFDDPASDFSVITGRTTLLLAGPGDPGRGVLLLRE